MARKKPPRTADYHRRPAEGAPTTPAEQAAEVERMAAEQRTRGYEVTTPTAADRLAADVRAALARYDAEQVAERVRAAITGAADAEQVRAALADAGRARRAWKSVEPDVPALIRAANAHGIEAPEITQTLGTAPSYVYRIIREQPAGEQPQTAAEKLAADVLANVEQLERDRAAEAARARADRAKQDDEQ